MVTERRKIEGEGGRLWYEARCVKTDCRGTNACVALGVNFGDIPVKKGASFTTFKGTPVNSIHVTTTQRINSWLAPL